MKPAAAPLTATPAHLGLAELVQFLLNEFVWLSCELWCRHDKALMRNRVRWKMAVKAGLAAILGHETSV